MHRHLCRKKRAGDCHSDVRKDGHWLRGHHHGLDHREYAIYETRYGGNKTNSHMVRVPKGMHAHIVNIALTNNSDCSTVIRNAVYEYLLQQGKQPFVVP